MTALAALLAAAEPLDHGLRVALPSDWAQGRTTYGGLSGAIALHAARAGDSDLPPLRSAQISFVGPLSGTIEARARRLRRGRNTAFIEVTLTSEAGIGLAAVFVFSAAIESTIEHDTRAPAPHAPPGPDAKVFNGFPGHFTQNFQLHDIREGAGPAEWRRWVRLRDHDGLDPDIALMAIADALPPAALKLTGGLTAPVSSISWMVNLLTPRPETRDGWWLMHSVTDRAAGGFSSQRMAVWSADGVRVADGMQGVAVFA